MYKHSRLCSVICYITWIGWAIALALRDSEDPLAHRHINQALVLNIAEVIGRFLSRQHGLLQVLGGIVEIGVFILAVVGIIRALRMSDEPLPLVGKIDWIR